MATYQKKRLKSFFKTLAFSTLLTASKVHGQATACDTIYNNPITMPAYKDGIRGLSEYLTDELIPIISGCMKQDSNIIASLYIILTIDDKGNVADAAFPKLKPNSTCIEVLKNKLLTMAGWTAGKNEERDVCSRFVWPISCIKWK